MDRTLSHAEERRGWTLSHRQRRGEDGHYHVDRGEERIDTIIYHSVFTSMDGAGLANRMMMAG